VSVDKVDRYRVRRQNQYLLEVMISKLLLKHDASHNKKYPQTIGNLKFSSAQIVLLLTIIYRVELV